MYMHSASWFFLIGAGESGQFCFEAPNQSQVSRAPIHRLTTRHLDEEIQNSIRNQTRAGHEGRQALQDVRKTILLNHLMLSSASVVVCVRACMCFFSLCPLGDSHFPRAHFAHQRFARSYFTLQAQNGMTELFVRIRDIRAKAELSEKMVQEITRYAVL